MSADARGIVVYLAIVLFVFSALYVGLKAKSFTTMLLGMAAIFGAAMLVVAWLVK